MSEGSGRKPTLARRLDRFYRYRLREPVLSRWRGWKRRAMPIAMVTGTAGKTTTTRLTAAILEAAGHRVAVATTDNVTIGGTVVAIGDLAGHPGHKIAMADRTATAAVLETARGGLIRFGLFIRPVTAAALLNVGSDHIGLDGVGSVVDMARVKRRVTDAARHVVLNADNRHSRALIRRYGARRVTLIARGMENPALLPHLASGGRVITCDAGGTMMLVEPGREPQSIMPVADIPVTLGGRANTFVANAMAAAGLGLLLGAGLESVRSGLAGFRSTVETNPGRFNILEGYPFRLVCDRSMNGHAIQGLVELMDQLAPAGRRILCFSMPGNRAEDQYGEVPRLVSGHFHHYVIYEMAHYRRGLPEGEITRRLREGLLGAGTAPDAITGAVDRDRALSAVSAMVQPGDFVLLIADLPDDMPAIEAAFAGWKEP